MVFEKDLINKDLSFRFTGKQPPFAFTILCDTINKHAVPFYVNGR